MTEPDTASESHRHACEVRFCIAQGYEWFEAYIKGVRGRRGNDAALRLWKDVKEKSAATVTSA